MNAPREPLEKALADWRVSPPRDPQFRARVWDRIAGARSAAGWTAYLRLHPAAVSGAIAAAITLGAIGGWTTAGARVKADSGRIATAYVHGLDARFMRMP